MPSQHFEREGGIKRVWCEMVGVKEKGLARRTGVSNFNNLQLAEVISMGLEKPFVNQVRFKPFSRCNSVFHHAKDRVSSARRKQPREAPRICTV